MKLKMLFPIRTFFGKAGWFIDLTLETGIDVDYEWSNLEDDDSTYHMYKGCRINISLLGFRLTIITKQIELTETDLEKEGYI